MNQSLMGNKFLNLQKKAMMNFILASNIEFEKDEEILLIIADCSLVIEKKEITLH